jgi:hypothetical protein
MNLVLFFPELTAYFKDASVGTVVAGSLIIVFLILALGFGIFQMRDMKKKMNLLDEETRARHAQELAFQEEFSGAPKGPAPKQMKDPWQS